MGNPLRRASGSRITPWLRQDRFILNGWVSDFNGGEDRVREAWQTIRRLHKSITRLTLTTELGTYSPTSSSAEPKPLKLIVGCNLPLN